MLLKRFYKTPPDWERKTDASGRCINAPPLDYVSLGHTGTSPEQNWPIKTVSLGVREGWMRIEKDKLLLLVQPETLVYDIKRIPGRYCRVCGEKLNDDATGELARLHMMARHPSDAPNDYEMLAHFETVLNSAQHERHKVRPGMPVVFPRKKEQANG